MDKNKYPKITLTFPTYNGGAEALNFLQSLADLNYPKDKIELIVVDNASTDDTANVISNFQARSAKLRLLSIFNFQILKNKKNVGFAKAVNQAIKKAKGEYVFITNDDIVLGKDSLRLLVNYHQNHPKTGILGGKIYSKSKPKKVVSSGYMMNIWTGRVFVNPEYNKQIEPDWVQGCALLIPKKLLDKVGPLDSEYSHFFEDYDLCLRSKNAGYKVVYLPEAEFWHRESTTANRDKPKKYYHWYRNKIRFILKNLSVLNIASILFLQLFFIAPYRAIVLGDGRFIPLIKGLRWNTYNLINTLSARFK